MNPILVKTNKMIKLKIKKIRIITMMRNTMVKNTTMKWMRKTSGTRHQCVSTSKLMELVPILLIATLLTVSRSSGSCLIIMFTHNIDSNAFIIIRLVIKN